MSSSNQYGLSNQREDGQKQDDSQKYMNGFQASTTSLILTPTRIWVALVLFRCLNAISVQTFFQPDEYFQALEPAWQIAFGSDSGAWITWVSIYSTNVEYGMLLIQSQEWHHQLRSSLHPSFFAGVYLVVDKLANFLQISPSTRAVLLANAPNIAQAFIAATGDFYTWRLSQKIYGVHSDLTWITVSSIYILIDRS